MRGARLGCFIAIIIAVCLGHTSSAWKEPSKAAQRSLPEAAEAAVTEETEQSAKVNSLVNKWAKMEDKASEKKASVDVLAAGIRVMQSLKTKKSEADKEYVKQAHLYAHTGGHPGDHKRDLAMPLKLEIASAQKNVVDLRYKRAQAQVALLRHKAEKMGAIESTGANDEDTQNEEEKTEELKVKDIQKEAKKADAKQERALYEFEEFKKHAKKAKLLERNLRKQKAVARALTETANKAASTKLKEEKTKLEIAAVNAKAAETEASIIRKQNAALSYKEGQVEADKPQQSHEEEVAKLKHKLHDSEKATKTAEESTTAARRMISTIFERLYGA